MNAAFRTLLQQRLSKIKPDVKRQHVRRSCVWSKGTTNGDLRTGGPTPRSIDPGTRIPGKAYMHHAVTQ